MKVFAPHRLLCVLWLTTSPGQLAAAQAPADGDGFPANIAVLGANALFGAVTGGVRALIEGGDIGRAFTRGALGGSLAFAGKRIAAARWGPAPLPGRLVSSLGSSIVANATAPGALDTISLAVGPVRLDFTSRRRRHPRVVLSINDLVSLVVTAAQPDLRIDWSRSVASLTPVFRTTTNSIVLDDDRVNGVTGGGIIVLDGRQGIEMGSTFRHEVVHLLQHDFMETAWDRPAQRWARTIVPGAGRVPRWLSINVLIPLLVDGTDVIAHGNGVLRRIGQAEAEWFEGR